MIALSIRQPVGVVGHERRQGHRESGNGQRSFAGALRFTRAKAMTHNEYDDGAFFGLTRLREEIEIPPFAAAPNAAELSGPSRSLTASNAAYRHGSRAPSVSCYAIRARFRLCHIAGNLDSLMCRTLPTPLPPPRTRDEPRATRTRIRYPLPRRQIS